MTPLRFICSLWNYLENLRITTFMRHRVRDPLNPAHKIDIFHLEVMDKPPEIYLFSVEYLDILK